MARKINIGEGESLRSGAEKINEAMEEVNSFQDQIDTIVVEGDSSVEAAQARIDAEGNSYSTLKERLDSEHTEVTSQLAQKQQEIDRLDDKKTDRSEFNSSKNNLSSKINNKADSKKQVELNPSLVFIDDDVRNELYDLIFPVLQQRNIPITSALISSRIDNHANTITYDQFKEMKDSGLVEYVNHTHEHVHLDELTEEEIDYQIRMCEEWLENEGIYTRHLVYPFGRYNETIRKIASKYVDSATIYGGAVFNPSSQIMDSYLIQRVQFEESLSTLQGHMDTAKNNNGLLIINTHSQYETFSVSKLNDIFDYAENNGIEILKFSEAYERFKNIVEIRKREELIYGIGAGGSNNIVESGTSDKGTFIRFADGTQWCIREAGINMTNSSVYTYSFPKPFKPGTIVHQWFNPGTSSIVPSAEDVHCLYGGGGFTSALRSSNVDGAYPESWRFNRTEDPNAPTSVPITLFAVGRWK